MAKLMENASYLKALSTRLTKRSDEVLAICMPVDFEIRGRGFYELAKIFGVKTIYRNSIPPVGMKYVMRINYNTYIEV
jgi:hypothetical protein